MNRLEQAFEDKYRADHRDPMVAEELRHFTMGWNALSEQTQQGEALTDELICRLADQLWEQGHISSLSRDTAVIFARAVIATALSAQQAGTGEPSDKEAFDMIAAHAIPGVADTKAAPAAVSAAFRKGYTTFSVRDDLASKVQRAIDLALSSPPSVGEPSARMVERMKAAIEGECDGLAIDDQHARAVLEYVLEAPPLATDSAKPAGEPSTFTMTVADALRIVDANQTRQQVEAAFRANVGYTYRAVTDEEISEVATRMEASDPDGSFWREFARSILALAAAPDSQGAPKPVTAEEAKQMLDTAHFFLFGRVFPSDGAQAAGQAPDGWKLVPIEPTEEMMEAEWNVTLSDAHTDGGVGRCAWAAMLNAAPQPPAAGQEDAS